MNSSEGTYNKGVIEWQIGSGELTWLDDRAKDFGISATVSAYTLDTFLSHVHDDDREITKRAIMLAMEHNRSNIFNFRFIRPDTGVELFIHSTWEIENDSAGKVVKVRGTLLDVTRRGIAA